MPLKKITASIKILNSIAKVSLEQHYLSDYDSAIETEYYFPVTRNMVFHSIKAEFDGKVINGRIQEKQEAKRSYEEHKEKGDTAAIAQLQED